MQGHGGRGAAIQGPDVDDDLLFMTAMRRLVAEDFSQTCAPDRACGACRPAPFCYHCCGEHHRGHDGVVAAALPEVGARGEKKKRYRRDSFCVGCGAAFCSSLCAHHGGEGHDVMRVDEYGGRQRWFHFFFDGVETYEHKDGNLMIPLQRRRPGAVIPEPGLKLSTRHPLSKGLGRSLAGCFTVYNDQWLRLVNCGMPHKLCDGIDEINDNVVRNVFSSVFGPKKFGT